ncbi:hypothetical protein [Yinghuangia seranimata]|uniref:hypothetical protein n=1 Tax=Yinghuangia seranimata TaxID=408067 RepID=UPI00248ACC23|nr:hypothetical protein [Yinghuangia seranimata]MDI2131444.1 hypothetical protein [Yinghuangia seranimata]
MTDSPGSAAPDAPRPDDPPRSGRSPEGEPAANGQETVVDAGTPGTGAGAGEERPQEAAGTRQDDGAGTTAAGREDDGTAPAEPDRTDAGDNGATPPPGWSPQQPPAAPGWGAPGGQQQAPPGWSPQQPPSAPGWGTPPPSGWGAPGGTPGWGAPPPPQTPMHGWGAPGGPAWGAPQGWQGPYLPAAKPGIIPLRPLGVGEMLDGAVAAMRAHWKVMIGLSLVVALITQAIVVPTQWALLRNVDTSVLDDPDATTRQINDVIWPVLGSSAVMLIIVALGQLFITGILTLVVSRAVIGKNMTLGQAWAGTRPLLWRLLGVSLMTFLIPLGLLLACLLPGAALAAAAGGAGGGALITLGVIGGAGLAIYAYICLSLSSPALILEKGTVGKSLRRSRKLVTNSWWRVMGITLLIGVLTFLIGGIVQMPFVFATGFSLTQTVPDSFLEMVVMGVGQVLSYGLTFPFGAAALVLLYIDQRMRREALDLELARAAGLVADDDAPAAP